jgi:hypothetical protein
MTRHSRRRAARSMPRQPARARRPLPLPLRCALVPAGAGLIVFGLALAAHGSGAHGGRVIGALALLGTLVIAVAWQGRI